MASDGFLASLNFGLPDLVGLGTIFALLALIAGWPWIRATEALWPVGRFYRMAPQIKDTYRAACKTLIDSERRKNTQASNDVRARQLARV